MKNEECASDVAILGFAEEVQARFSFLETRGFRAVRCDGACVRYESPRLRVILRHDRRSFELTLALEPAHSSTDTFSLADLLRLAGRPADEHERNYASHTVPGVAEGVRQLAGAFEPLVAGGFLDDARLFPRLQRQQREQAETYAYEAGLRQARKSADAAWHAKDYPAVVRALTPLRAVLSETEAEKLEFAKQRRGR